jgi:hypothetical protein
MLKISLRKNKKNKYDWLGSSDKEEAKLVPKKGGYDVKQADTESLNQESDKASKQKNFETMKEEKHKERKQKRMNKRRILKIFNIIIGVVGVVLIIFGVLFYRIYDSASDLKQSADRTIAALDGENTQVVKDELGNTKIALNNFDNTYKSIGWMKAIPYFGEFVEDGEYAIVAGRHGLEAAEIAIDTIEARNEEPSKDKFDFVLKALPLLSFVVNDLSKELSEISNQLNYINTGKYPEEMFGFKVRSYIESVINAVELSNNLLENGKPLMEIAPSLLGSEEERKYLILFQNDKELRPTGGFMTAYAVAKVRNGIFEPVSSSDIYDLDDNYKPSFPAPEPIVKYLKGPYLESDNFRLRDMNWVVNFADSMELFIEEAQTAGVEEVDGVIAVDTQLLVYLLDAIGPIDVTGYGSFSTETVEKCNCPQVIYELESFADIGGPVVWSENEPGKVVFAPPNYDNRKKIIGPLMNSILSGTLEQSNIKIPLTVEALLKSINEKHILFWMKDEDTQLALEELGISGRLEDYNGDYLYINDANLGGRKSNLYVKSEIEQEIDIEEDEIVKTVTITYRNPVSYDGWLNSVLPNYVRIYTPKGSELIKFSGVVDKTDPYVEYGKTVFAGFFELNPDGVAIVTLKYKLPFEMKDQYSLYIQKQPGTDAPLHTIILGDEMEEVFLWSDEEVVFDLNKDK